MRAEFQAILDLAVGWVAAIAFWFAYPFEYALTDVLFRMALAFSLSLGFVAAFPVNVLLVKFGVKEGMVSPAEKGGGSRTGRPGPPTSGRSCLSAHTGVKR